MSFSPEEIGEEIKKVVPEFKMSYHEDFRQSIADSWPKSIDDTRAREDWGWEHTYDLEKMSKSMLQSLHDKYEEL
jgi:nucleoside-diphosphate-sugar epimerase